jgi:hypothetical protein
VLADLRTPDSESALIWNLVYPRAQPRIGLRSLLGLTPLWGSIVQVEEDPLEPFYWGYSLGGERLTGLDSALDRLDGPGQQTEVDLFLVGERNLIAVEAKRTGGPGKCDRFMAGRCPEVQLRDAPGCRYWEDPESRFSTHLELGLRPTPGSDPPPCNTHYQLARTLLVVAALAAALGRQPHLWLWVPERRWPGLELEWLDFSERVIDPELWRRLRVMAWETVRSLPLDK